MKFAVLQFFSWPQRRIPLPDVYQRALDRIKQMDQTGYDAVWLAEHHFSTYSVCPSVHVMAMHVADITKKIRIGTGVSLAGFYHPLRLAEEVALLDQLTGGRINWGAGRGFDATEFDVFGVPREESYDRFREHVEIVLKAWSNERISYTGIYNKFDNIEVLPKPLQQPMPYWVAASSLEAIEWSAEQGHPILMDPHSSHEAIGQKYARYQELLANNDKRHDKDTPITRLVAIGRTENEAETVARSGAQWMFGSYFNSGRGSSHSNIEERLESYVTGNIVYGTSEQVVDKLLELEESIPLKYMVAAPLSHRSFELFTYEVIPQLS